MFPLVVDTGNLKTLSRQIQTNRQTKPIGGFRKMQLKISGTMYSGWPLLLLSLVLIQVPNAQSQQQDALPLPIFTRDMNLFTVKENVELGRIVYKLEAHVDYHEQANIMYRIDGTNLFSAHRYTGQVRVAGPIDREQTTDSVSFKVTATANFSSNRQSSSQLSVTVYILDENDNAPRIERVRIGNNQFDSNALYGQFNTVGPASTAIQPVIRRSISESAPIGSVLLDMIEVLDVDTASQQPLAAICLDCDPEFELRSQEPALNDRLNLSILVLNQLVHLPRRNMRQFTVVVSDGKFNSSLLVEIDIEDVQNKPPKFVSSTTCILPEESPVDKVVMTLQAIDGDAIGIEDAALFYFSRNSLLNGRPILYDLVEEFSWQASINSLFKMHPLTGQLQVAGDIDREAYLVFDGVLKVRVRARELTVSPDLVVHPNDIHSTILEKLEPYVDNSPEAMKEEDLTITLIDANDNAPRWLNKTEITNLNVNSSPYWFSSLPTDKDIGRSTEYEFYIRENSLVGSPLTAKNEMFVYDLDSGDNSRFNIALSNPRGLFSVEPKQVSGFAMVSLKLAKNPNASSKDQQNAARVLDYEDPNQRVFIIELIATETNTLERFTSKAHIRVKVVDVNDNPPEFRQTSYRAKVSEDALAGKVILTVQATDKDEISQQLYYSLHGQTAHLFAIDRFNGTVRVARCEPIAQSRTAQSRQLPATQCIDYEHQKQHYLTVEVSDGELSSKVPLNIAIEDASDNPPVFVTPVVEAVIEEGVEKLDPPIKIEATDVDDSSVLSYSIVEGNIDNLFEINKATGELQLTRAINLTSGLEGSDDIKINVPQLTKITLIVQATDGVFETNGTIRIDVLDANNNAPEFIKPHYNVDIHEFMSPGQMIIKVQANDRDDGFNAKLSYKIQRGSYGQFEIDQSSGYITVAKNAVPFENDKRENYTLEVVVEDHGYPKRSSSILVHIRVLDTLIKPPEFEPQVQKINIPESTSNATSIHRMSISDQARNKDLSLVFDTGPIEALDQNGVPVVSDGEQLESMFIVSSKTGDVLVNSKLEHEFAAYINLTVYVRYLQRQNQSISLLAEEYHPRSVGYLIITVLDDNSHPPVFAAPWSPHQPELVYKMLEELPVGSVLTQLVADDMDSKISHFKIEPANEYFELKSPQSGIITNRKLIDYESLMQQTFIKPKSRLHNGINNSESLVTNEGNNIIQFNVYVYDSGVQQLHSKAIISVEILPVNDWECEFEHPVYEVHLKENAPADSLLVQVRAIDQDYGEQHNSTRYQLIGEYSNLFNINERSGLITVSNAGSILLDREGLARSSFTLTVLGTDKQTHLSDMSRFQNGLSKFNKSTIINSTADKYCLTTVKVNLDDINDNPPLFTQRIYEVTAYDTDVVNVPLAKLLVRDDDTKSMLTLANSTKTTNSFRIVAGNLNDSFSITSSGLLQAIKPLGKLLADQHSLIQLRVQVRQQPSSSSAGQPAFFTDECMVRINLFKLNRYGPEWRSESLKSISVTENLAPGTFVTQLRCIDRDYDNQRVLSHQGLEAGSNRQLQDDQQIGAALRYWIKKDGSKVSETAEFRLNPKTGNLTTRIPLDREEQEFHQLVVVCEDNGKPLSLESVTPLLIMVADVDDNKPEFIVANQANDEAFVDYKSSGKKPIKKLSVTFSIEEHQSSGIPVGDLKAYDPDKDSKYPINYCLIEGNDFQEFYLDRITGILYTNQTLDREKQATYNLLVKAINDGYTCEEHMNNEQSTTPLATTDKFKRSSWSSGGLDNSNNKQTKDKSLVLVRVNVLDINDNAPSFKKPIYRAGVHHKSLMNSLITQVSAYDPDTGINSSVHYKISEIFMFKIPPASSASGVPSHRQQSASARPPTSQETGGGQLQTLGKPIKLIQFPFKIDQQGYLYTQQLLSQYQLMSMFLVHIEATEVAEPCRSAKTKLEIYTYETNSQLKIRFNLHPRFVESHGSDLESLLSNATKYLAIINPSRSFSEPSTHRLSSAATSADSRQPDLNYASQFNHPITSSYELGLSAASQGAPNQPSFSDINLIFVDNHRIVNPNLVMEKFDLRSAQLFKQHQQTTSIHFKDANNNNLPAEQEDASSINHLDNAQARQQQTNNQRTTIASGSAQPQFQPIEVSSLIDRISIASMQSAEYQASTASGAGIDWLESPSALYLTLSIGLFVIGFVMFLFGCCCTSRIKDHIVRAAMDKLAKQQNLQSKINEQVYASAHTNSQSLANLNGDQQPYNGQEFILQRSGLMTSFDTTKGCVAGNTISDSVSIPRDMDACEYIDPNYTTLDGHINLGAHYYDASCLDAEPEADRNNAFNQQKEAQMVNKQQKQQNGSNGSLSVTNVGVLVDGVATSNGAVSSRHMSHKDSSTTNGGPLMRL